LVLARGRVNSAVGPHNDVLTHDMFRHWHNLLSSILIFAVLLTLALMFFVYPWYKDRSVAARQQTASATIVAHEPANHNRYGYTFNVNQKTFSGWLVPHDSDQFAVGQLVTIHYDPLDPNNSGLVDFNELADGDLAPVLPLAAIIAFVALIEFLRRRGTSKSTGVVSG
jgi:hypothetical protein